MKNDEYVRVGLSVSFGEERKIREKMLKVAAAAIFFAALTAFFFGNSIKSAFAATAGTINLPFSYSFTSSGTLDESKTEDSSSSPYWWLLSGGRMIIANGVGSTISGDLSKGDKWYKYYSAENPESTDGGLHPQNVFRLFLRKKVLNPSVEVYINRKSDNFANKSEAYHGESLIAHYTDDSNFYYAGLRADGGAVIKKKINGTYYTLGFKKVFDGTYTDNSDLIPLNKWIGLRMAVSSDPAGAKISLYTDVGRTGNWTLALEAIDNIDVFGPLLETAGYVGIQSDFADASMDSFALNNGSGVVQTQVTQPTTSTPTSSALFTDTFGQYSDGLITNEYAFWNPTASDAKVSANWELDSGSLFASGGTGWTGVPNSGTPDADSNPYNNSVIFRMVTKQSNFGNASVNFDLLNQGLSTSSQTPAVAWDGVHIFLRYQSEYNLYYASINRRDNTVLIKKKVPGGPSNGGTYYVLGTSKPYQVPYNSWQKIKATIKTNSDGSVTINLYSNGILLATATDNGSIGGAPILKAGKVGVRGDNANLKFKNFTVLSF